MTAERIIVLTLVVPAALYVTLWGTRALLRKVRPCLSCKGTGTRDWEAHEISCRRCEGHGVEPWVLL